MLNENIHALRKSKGLSQEELAPKLNVVMMWQHLLEQIYERIRPASLNSTGLM